MTTWISGNTAAVLHTMCLFYFIPMCIVDVLPTHQFLSFLFCIVLEHTCMQPLWQLSGLQAGGLSLNLGLRFAWFSVLPGVIG
jgi:hypothetical protein